MSQCTTKPTKWHVRTAKTQICLAISPVWSESLLSAWRKIRSWAIHWAHSEDWSDWAVVPPDLSLRWAHIPFCRLCHALTPMSITFRRLCNAHSFTEHTRYVFRILRIIFCLQPQSIRLNTDKDLLTLKIKSSWNTLCSKQTIWPMTKTS